MTLHWYTGITQTALSANADLYSETHAAMKAGLIDRRRGTALQTAISLVRYLAQDALANGTEATVGPSEEQQTRVLGHVTGDRPR